VIYWADDQRVNSILVRRSTDPETGLRVLVDPVSLAVLPLEDLAGREPEADLLLGALDAVRAVADVAADVLFAVSMSRLRRLVSGALQERSHRGWCQGQRQGGWWRPGWL
jgi:hypothetical protein